MNGLRMSSAKGVPYEVQLPNAPRRDDLVRSPFSSEGGEDLAGECILGDLRPGCLRDGMG